MKTRNVGMLLVVAVAISSWLITGKFNGPPAALAEGGFAPRTAEAGDGCRGGHDHGASNTALVSSEADRLGGSAAADLEPLLVAWSELDSPLHNGDRSEPIMLEPLPGRRIAFFVDRVVQKDADYWYAVGRTGGEASAVVATRVGQFDVLVVTDPTSGDQFSILSDGKVTEVLPEPAAGCGGGIALSANRLPAVEPVGPSLSTFDQFWDDLTAPPSSTRITVAGFYTAALAAQKPAGFRNRLLAQMEAGVQLLNVAFDRARADAHVELVGVQEIDWDPTEGGSITDLDSSATASSFSKAIEAATKGGKVLYASDLRVGVPHGTSSTFAGVAYLHGRDSVVFMGGLSTLVFPHEIGHNLGLHHNREDAGATEATSGYHFGHREAATNPAVYTIMSYQRSGHLWILAFSDPDFRFQDVPLGVANRADNARMAREQVKTAANHMHGDRRFIGDNWLINQSTRGYVGTGGDVMIAGFVVRGSRPKKVVIRGIGPTLTSYGVDGALADPKLEIFAGSTKIAENDDWALGERAGDLQAIGLTPAHAKDAAVVLTLAPGNYTAVLSGVNDAKGVGLVEAFGIEPSRQKLVGVLPIVGRQSSTEDSWIEGMHPYLWLASPKSDADLLVAITDDRPGYRLRRSAAGEVRETDEFVLLRDHPQRTLIQSTAPHVSEDHAVWLGRIQAGEYVSLVGPPGVSSHRAEGRWFEADQRAALAPDAQFINLSTRALIGTGDKSLIAGVVVSGNTPKAFLFRALGENLRQYGINNPAKKIVVGVHDAKTRLHQFTATTSDDRTGLQARGMLTPHATDISGFVTLAPGAYTIVLSAATEADSGVGLVEVYEIE